MQRRMNAEIRLFFAARVESDFPSNFQCRLAQFD
jgi:hypothetical protein